MAGRGFGLRFCAAMAALLAGLGAARAAAQDAPAVPRSFSLADRLWVDLTSDWVERRDEHAPPPPLLAATAPPFHFADILVLENRKATEVLKLGISENPFLGSFAPDVDARMQAGEGSGLVNHLFYFFAPPPRNCLASARAALDAARREEERRAGEEEKKRPPRTVSVVEACEFGSTPLDFYAEQVSSGLALDSGGRSRALLRGFYVPHLEQVELDGKTFFLFEAQGQRFVGRAELDKFNLPEELVGARAYLFWAIGAESPFPFARDPLRKNVPLLHLFYATLSTTGTAAARFREKLRRLRFAP